MRTENEKQLTAVEWLIENMPNISHKIGLGLALEITAKFQQAKELERQQLIDAHESGSDNICTAKVYFNHTFKTQ